MLKFLARFILLMALAYSLTAIPWFQHTLFPNYLRFNATIAEFALRAIGQDVVRSDLIISSGQFALQVQRGCDGLEPTLLLIAAIIAFPACWRLRGVGIVVGIAALLALNVVRIASLLLIGTHWPKLFHTAHVELWQLAFIACTVLIWTTWAWWCSRKKTKPAHAVA